MLTDLIHETGWMWTVCEFNHSGSIYVNVTLCSKLTQIIEASISAHFYYVSKSSEIHICVYVYIITFFSSTYPCIFWTHELCARCGFTEAPAASYPVELRSSRRERRHGARPRLVGSMRHQSTAKGWNDPRHLLATVISLVDVPGSTLKFWSGTSLGMGAWAGHNR